ncbi:xanthine dehydrogenase family protein molybdopterin-binding subunit [Variovorax sp. OV329]|uniref:xanthine dehydrogenase family protein molybdopterin-binding subunit n=1 Tax=Variovorax sp. OV329 TaxID=1882825 RepID=UPI0008E8ED95|nr:xanthine dehydrogenase family protein molybdopterin-binding subunit [Variovorax sp. OV329]SFM83802.1 carbon-monoxide dehydrogenase large subunit [Variovorax sp. OV329]
MSALPDNSTPEAKRFGSGQAVPRLEDEQLLTGRGRYTDDLALPGQLHVAFLRSPYPHARIVSIDSASAAAMPGVVRIYTGADLVAAGLKPIPGVAGFRRPDGQPAGGPDRLALAHERARFVGEPVVAVVAETLQQARDAAEAVYVEFEELPMVVGNAAAMAAGAPVLSEEGAPGNICAEMRHGDAKAAQAGFDKAAHVVRLTINNQRLAAVTLEPRSVLAAPEGEDGKRTALRMSTQMPTGVRDTLAGMLGIENTELRLQVNDVGGGFGMKTGLYPEDAVVGVAARDLKRPVKWIADRSEEFLATTHGRDVEVQAEMALAADGRILALRLHSVANVGAYPTGAGVAIQLLIGPWVQTSVYDIPVIDFRFQAVLTNTAPTGAYRGAGRPEAIFNMERLMDEAARQSGIDRVQLRRRNFIRPEQMPYTNPMAQVYDSGRFEHVMKQGLALADWDGFGARAAQSQSRGRVRGLGIATFLEWTGGNALQESVTVSVLAEEGVVEVFSAVNAMGQGIATSLTQLVVDVFGVPPEQVRVVLGDTDRGNGFGSAGSRSLFTGGSALHDGAEKTISHARGLAAKELEASADDIDYALGRFSVKGTDLSIGLFELAGKQSGRRIVIDSSTTVGGPSWPNGCHVCEVELDPATGEVDVVSYASVNDVGNVVNPMIVRGQLDGGAVQGLGQALLEQVAYDPETGQLLTGSLMDYALPVALQAPPFRTEMDTSTPCLTNPLGVKGVGELGTIGATPSVVNAVADAFARAGHADKTTRLQMPLTPARLWQLLQD